jgi:hypothetical protein
VATEIVTHIEPPTAEGIVTWCGVSREDERFKFLAEGVESMLRRYVETCGLAETHKAMCGRLREYCDWRHLGLGGETLDRLVLEHARKLEIMLSKMRGYLMADLNRSELARRLDKEAIELMPHMESQSAKETVRCVHCDEPIFDNGTVWVHLRPAGFVDKPMIMAQTQWCYDRVGSTMAESRGMANARTVSSLTNSKNVEG